MLNVEGLTLRLNHPSRNGRVNNAVLVEMEDEFLAMLEFGFHFSFSQ